MKQTKSSRLMSLLARRWLTPLDALRLCGVLSLAQRVSEWRADGISIVDKWVTTPSGARVKAYRLPKPADGPFAWKAYK